LIVKSSRIQHPASSIQHPASRIQHHAPREDLAMRKLGKTRQFVVVLLVLAIGISGFPTAANACEVNLFSVIVDLLIVRPLSIAFTAAGAVLFVVGIPFSAAGGNTEEILEILVQQPADYAFSRPLGCLRQE
jgi:hypothetical protein